MLNDIDLFSDQDIYRARFELAGALAQSEGLALHYSKDIETRAQATMLRAQNDRVRARLESVLRPR